MLKLSNLVLASELIDDQEVADITEDVRNEVSIQLQVLSYHLLPMLTIRQCLDFGRVLCVLIPRAKDGFPLHSEGTLFILSYK